MFYLEIYFVNILKFGLELRSSYELEVILNYNGEQTTWTPGRHQTLGTPE